MNYESKNTVKAEGQINLHVFFDGDLNSPLKITIIGNSITRHAPAPQIGWNNDWGMAASALENDYVHKIMAKVRERRPEAAFCVVQAAVWEVDYGIDFDKYFAKAKDFHPDIIVTAISANIKPEKFEHDSFIENMAHLHNYLGMEEGRVKLIQTSSFFNNEKKTEAIRDYLNMRGGDLVFISDLPKDPSNLAIGLFEHEGIQGHPGDKGMAEMANRIFEKLKVYI